MSETQKTEEKFNLSEHDKQHIESLLGKVGQARQQNERIAVVSRNELADLLSEQEIHIIDRVFDIDPAIYGFKGPKLELEPVPNDLVKVAPQPYRYKGEEYYTNVQFVPRLPYDAFTVMASAMQEQIGRRLLIGSSYRSSDFQATTFLKILKMYRYDVTKTSQRAAIPGYSEHGTPSQLAFDVQNVDGLPSDETPQDFEGTPEYNWLVENASRFDFYMSYPKDNPYGLMFEPWHWRHKPPQST